MKPISQPRQTITGRLWLGFGLLILVVAVTLLIYYLQTQRISSGIRQTIEVQEPLERVVLQMQTNIDNNAQTVSHYISNRNPADAKKVRDSEVDFGKLTIEFGERAKTEQLEHLGHEITRLYAEFEKSSYESIVLSDSQHAVLLLFEEDVEELEDLISGMLQAAIGGTSLDTTNKLKATFGMQNSLNKISEAISAYAAKPDSAISRQILDEEEDFKKAWASFQNADLSIYENSWLYQVDEEFKEISSAGVEIVLLSDNMHELLGRFEQSFMEIDSYLENEVQPFVHNQVLETSAAVQASIASSNGWLLFLGIIGMIIGGVSVWIISRNIARPVNELVNGAAMVANGKYEHRFNIDARGELGQTAFFLNQMLDNLGRSRDALSESEELAWAVLDATSDAVILTDLRGRILASNEIAATRFGKSLEQMIDESLYDLIPAGPAASVRSHIAEAVRSGKPVHYEDEREGKIIDQNIYPVLDGKGEVSRIAIFARDVTVRKWVEDVTEQLGRRNELILEAAGEGIYGLDTEGKTTFVNPAAARMLGYEPDELIGQSHHEIAHHSKPDGRSYPNEECPVYTAFKDGAVHTNVDDEVFWRKDGTCFPVEYTSTPIIENGKILGAVVTYKDITDRKRLENVLRQSEEKYRSIFESATSLIVSVDEESVIIDCNARLQQMLGYSLDEILGHNLLDIVHPDDHTAVRACLEEALTKGFKYNNQFRMFQRDDTFIEVTMNTAVTRDANGDYVRTICMIDRATKQVRK